ncbi:Retrovirus-related Pol polyprotein from transposon opus [Portunus trituberculatus]|uniref:Retrovirus-related Pol polyprotein from transposon opus n=1 Tax=Portunus trituberculatus TaxID=210409 RepID=A0A5B7IC34_PORTR|nr:Retrovirus-related Pol polyprotein from transposon opus [Portunus trituberculatus]
MDLYSRSPSAILDSLGFILGSDCLQPQPDKVEALFKIPPPSTKKLLRGFIEILSFYKSLIPQASFLTAPLTDLLHRLFSSTSQGPSEHLTGYLEPRQQPDGRKLPGLSKDCSLLCCPGFTLYLLPGAVNESASSVGEISVLLALTPSEGDSW